MKIIHYLQTILAVGLCLTACTNPITPTYIQSFEEPDTVRSTVSAIVNGKPWKFVTPDTVSLGAYDNNGNLYRRDEPLYNIVSAKYDKVLNSPFSVGGGGAFNVRSREVQVTAIVNGVPSPTATTTGAVRDWQSSGLYFAFRMPKNITLPFLLEKDSLDQFSWSVGSYFEVYRLFSFQLPGGNNPQWSITVDTRVNEGIEIKYRFGFGDPIYQGRYDSRVERAWLRIDRYDLVKWRVSGAFSFRATNLKGETVDIENGTFENVKLDYFERISQ